MWLALMIKVNIEANIGSMNEYLIVAVTIHEMRHHGESPSFETIAAFPQAAKFVYMSGTVRLTRVNVHFMRSFKCSIREKRRKMIRWILSLFPFAILNLLLTSCILSIHTYIERSRPVEDSVKRRKEKGTRWRRHWFRQLISI